MNQRLDADILDARIQQAYGASEMLAELSLQIHYSIVMGQIPAQAVVDSDIYRMIGRLLEETHTRMWAASALQREYEKTLNPTTPVTIPVNVGEEVPE